MNDMWGCWTSDIIVGYCYERDYNFVDQPQFRAFFTDAMIDLLDPVHFITQFPWVMKIFQSLPNAVVTYMQPGMASVIHFNKVRWSGS